ncbi:hypothetical protein SPRG_19044 [Saprolegnia parasitica CBS 223.65]|uniref:glutathione gamma-glutamylcysteinyltransferase n=1 Tax=Saprolegnia parasitica (strain CBS 223.65) TaxID=695850 RepID=A0A067CU58_SAPPC|nr:hypothetical protein SPRG_19044 [Saprolegnia parasitica CBS 223.65]KDO34204.1 hypothetical protein SPRG_19044 [Saprolegnia parasitica CBS 223.65]|eukprot:XP_012195242.1 hypothetical protein SPRG_19044 [Saprolegnia parasitica CBS 223.65]
MATSSLPYVEPPTPPSTSVGDRLRRAVFVTLLSILGLPYMLYACLAQRATIGPLLTAARRTSIKLDAMYKDSSRLARAWSTPIGQRYLCGGLEYQRREGYCASATLRNVLKSVGRSDVLPAPRRGASTPKQYVAALDHAGCTRSRIVYGSDGYDVFRSALLAANDPSYRVAVNFLRSPLFGFNGPTFAPFNFILGVFGGHFSNVIGFLDDEDLVVIFDVNHTYGPYLVDAKRLYSAVNTYDQTAKRTRALVVSKVLEDSD